MLDFITAALPWIVMGMSIAIVFVILAKKKSAKNPKDRGSDEKHDIAEDIDADEIDNADETDETDETDNADNADNADDTDDDGGNYMTEGMSIGMCIGVALGTALMDRFGSVSLTYGISIGMCIGLAIGSGIHKNNSRK